jgi:ATP-binding cassette subfamily F protein uup
MDRLVEHVFVMEGEGKVRDFPGNYTDYRDWRDSPAEKTQFHKMINQLRASTDKNQTPAPVVSSATGPTEAHERLRRKNCRSRKFGSMKRSEKKLSRWSNIKTEVVGLA